MAAMYADLTAVVVVLGAALAVAWLMRALRAPTIIGFLAAGILIGPSGLGLVHESKVAFLAELGLVMLLFTVGLELSPAPLLRMGKRLVAAAGLQMATTATVVALALVLGPRMLWPAAIVAGLAVSLSSTAIVLKHLTECDEIDSPAGAITTGVLLLQDIGVILVLILLPLASNAGGGAWGAVTLKVGAALGGLIVVTLLARLALPAIVNQVFRFGGRELMPLFAIAAACTGAWLAGLAHWSWGLGSFIVGLLLAQTDLRHQLQAEIAPFRDTLNALFFMSIGMLVDLDIVRQHAAAIGAAIVGILVIKAALATGAVVIAGWPLRLALTAGLGLCTISEFGYVLGKEATRVGLLPPGSLPALVACTVGTMLLGALLVPVAGVLAAGLARRLQPGAPAAAPRTDAGATLSSHVIVVGYGVNGCNLARVLRATRIPFVVIELNRASADQARKDGCAVMVGDAARLAILHEAGLAAARGLVISIADQQATRLIVAQAHAARPDLYILARTRYVAELDRLYRLGARQVIPEEFETSIEIFAHVLKEFAIPDNVVDQQVALVRAGRYGMLRGRLADRTLRTEWLQILEAAVTQTYLVMEGSPACARTIRDLDLRARTGVTVVAVTRAGKPVPNPTPDFQLASGDVLVLVGTHKQLDAARAALEPAAGGTDIARGVLKRQ
jgi:CPA2 family monovalent cation:H+ antiporter-2